MLRLILAAVVLAGTTGFSLDADAGLPVDQVLQMYVQALGGQAALDRILSRQLEVSRDRHAKATYYWKAPNKVLCVAGKVRQGFDGSTAWLETKRKKVEKLPRSVQDEMQTDANPVRYARLRDLFAELNPAPRQTVDGRLMDVIVSPNHIGATKLFFNSSTHLLERIEEFGGASAYFPHSIEFSEYKEFDGIKLPTRIERESDEPGAEHGTARLSKIEQNVDLNAAIFNRPNIGAAVLGGKR